MSKNIKAFHVLLALLGIVLAAVGFAAVRLCWALPVPLPYLSIGLGCGLFGHGMGAILQQLALHKHPEEAERIAVEQADERNQAIQNIAKGRAFDAMTFLYAAVLLCCALAQVELWVTLMFVAAYLTGHGIYLYHVLKLGRDM